MRGYTETLFGRRRPIPELSNSNFRIRQAGERQAMNAGIQGLAADIFKVALVRLDGALEEGGYASRLVLQVHDEVLVEVPEDERGRSPHAVVDIMRGAADLDVPLEVNVVHGAATWADAKSLTVRVPDGVRAAGPLVRADGRAPGPCVPPLLVHEGHGAGGRPPSRRPGLVRAIGCSTSAVGPAAMPSSSRQGEGIACHGIDISGRFVVLDREAPPVRRSSVAGTRRFSTTRGSTRSSRCARARPAWSATT